MTITNTGYTTGITVTDTHHRAVDIDTTASTVEFAFEAGCKGLDGCGIHEQYITITREDWDAIVAHVAAHR